MLKILFICLLLGDPFDVVCMGCEQQPDTMFYRRFSELKKNDSEQAAIYAQLYLDCSDKGVTGTVTAQVYEYLAEYYSSHEFDYGKAIGYLQKAVDIYRRLEDRKAAAKAEAALAKLYIATNDIGEGMDLIYRCMDESIELGYKSNIVKCNLLLGNTHYKIGDLNAAYEYYAYAASLASSIGDKYQEIMATNNMAVVKFLDGSGDVGLALCNINLKEAERLGFDDLIFPTYSNMGTICMRDNPDSARYYVLKSGEYADNILNKALYLSNMGLYYQWTGNSRKALDCYNKAIDYYRQGDFNAHLSETYRNIYAECLNLRDTIAAFRALQNYYKTENLTPKRDILIKLYKAKNQENEQKLKTKAELELARNRMWLVVSTFIFTLILLAVYIFYTKRRHRAKETLIKYQLDLLDQSKIQEQLKQKQEQTEYALRSKEDILKVKKLEEYQTNQLIDAIIEKLEKLNSSEDLEMRKKGLRKVIEDLKENKNSTNWEEVEQYLIKMNSRFYDNLTSQLPRLTINEKRLCIFLHMNMTSKEIANITHQNVASIEMARFRLRKKLDIKDPSESLHMFLQRYN